MDVDRQQLETDFVLEAHGLNKTYTQGSLWRKRKSHSVLNDVHISLKRGTTFGLVGRSGAGKTTLAMCLVGLERPDSGQIVVDGCSIRYGDNRFRGAQRRVQLIFQDSLRAMSPRMTVRDIVEEPILISGQLSRIDRVKASEAIMDKVGIPRLWHSRRPHELSGGQRQLVSIARSLTLHPKVLILDELFVGLDLSVRGQLANLLIDLQIQEQLSYICITHDFALITHLATDVGVLEHGRLIGYPTEGDSDGAPRRFGTRTIASIRKRWKAANAGANV